jgi:hypothetical protein
MSKKGSSWLALGAMARMYANSHLFDIPINSENPRKKWKRIEHARKHNRSKKRRRKRR